MPADALVLGVGGMLGHLVARVTRERYKTLGAARGTIANAIHFDVCQTDAELLGVFRRVRPGGTIINAVGMLAARLNQSDNPSECERGLTVNAVFPHRLARLAAGIGLRVIHISTDSVFPHNSGIVTEATPIGPEDIYGLTKAAGELSYPHCLTIRCSIIGPPGPSSRRGLWAWILDQPQGATIVGYSNRRWAGVTTGQLGEVCATLIEDDQFAVVRNHGAVHHLAPNPVISKFVLVDSLARLLRADIIVTAQDADPPWDRQLHSRYGVLDRLAPKWKDWPAALAAMKLNCTT